MTSDPYYCLDTNVYIGAYHGYYAFDLVESFWKHLATHAKSGRVVSIDRIRDEIQPRDPSSPLSAWIDNIPFETTNRQDVIHYFTAITRWVNENKHYLPEAKTAFYAGADGWLVAFAKATNRTLVTFETSEPARRGRVKIPDVCKHFGVPYCNTFDMLRALKLKLG